MWSGLSTWALLRISASTTLCPSANSLLGPHAGALCVTCGYVHPRATHCDTLDISTEDKMHPWRAQQLTPDSAHKDTKSTPQDVTDSTCPERWAPTMGVQDLPWDGVIKPMTLEHQSGSELWGETVKLTVHLSSLLF